MLLSKICFIKDRREMIVALCSNWKRTPRFIGLGHKKIWIILDLTLAFFVFIIFVFIIACHSHSAFLMKWSEWKWQGIFCIVNKNYEENMEKYLRRLVGTFCKQFCLNICTSSTGQLGLCFSVHLPRGNHYSYLGLIYPFVNWTTLPKSSL